MKSRPMLYQGAMVRAILDDSKTKTRRIFKAKNGGLWPNSNDLPGMKQIMRNCPYGQVGDRLWVREAWRAPMAYELTPPRDIPAGTPIVYQADGAGSLPHFNAGKLRPGMFMPRWASRIELEITGIRIERLNDISRGDAMAEGCPFPNMADGKNPCDWYMDLWEQINGAGSWAANPYVWVIEFKKVKP